MKERIAQAVREIVGEEFTVELHEVTKNNGVVLTGLTVRGGDSRISPNIYLDEYIRELESGDAELEDIARAIVNIYEKNNSPAGALSFLDRSREQVLENVEAEVVNTEKNRELLEGVPHLDFMDLSVIFREKVDVEGSAASFIIKNEYADSYDITLEDLKEASIGTNARAKYITHGMSELMEELTGESIPEDQDMGMVVVTNKDKLYGATAIMFPTIFKELAARFRDNLFIIPSSIHELIVLPEKTCEAMAIRQMVRDVNSTQLAPDEVLSNNLYRYDVAQNMICMA